MTAAEYLIKFSLSLSLVYIFYRVLLRPLTFYQWNRMYLLGYVLLSFALPFVNVTPWLVNDDEKANVVANFPPVAAYMHRAGFRLSDLTITDWLGVVFLAGVIVGLVRLSLQVCAYVQMKKRSRLVYKEENLRLYETTLSRGAFTFGNSIYVNTSEHSAEELQRIIQHEIVHVKQAHTMDLVLAELVCIINWYNPFAWLLKKCIRQNLEFIADNNVLVKGYDRKQYQYLLLKVIGAPQFSVASHFNIADLKKRIAMMNKMKSARVHLTKFLFAVPLLGVMLLAFRSEQQQKTEVKQDVPYFQVWQQVDTVPAGEEEQITSEPVQAPSPSPERANKKGYHLSVVRTGGQEVVLIQNMRNKSVEAMTIADWNNNKKWNENKYGKLPSPIAPVPPAPPVPTAPTAPPVAPVPPVAPMDVEALEEALQPLEDLALEKTVLTDEQQKKIDKEIAKLNERMKNILKNNVNTVRVQELLKEHQEEILQMQERIQQQQQELQKEQQKRNRQNQQELLKERQERFHEKQLELLHEQQEHLQQKQQERLKEEQQRINKNNPS